MSGSIASQCKAELTRGHVECVVWRVVVERWASGLVARGRPARNPPPVHSEARRFDGRFLCTLPFPHRDYSLIIITTLVAESWIESRGEAPTTIHVLCLSAVEIFTDKMGQSVEGEGENQPALTRPETKKVDVAKMK